MLRSILLNLSIAFSTFSLSFGQLTERPLGSTPAANGYIEYLPASYTTNPTKKLPLLLFFHGISEGGNGTTELTKVYNTGLSSMIKNNTWTYKNEFVVLMPQHFNATSCFSATEIKNFIDYARKAYKIDTLRVYLTGLSCGAIGIWNYMGANPTNTKVAAAVPIAGDGRGAYNQAKCKIQIPIWAFHGTADPTVSQDGTVIPMNALNACPTPRAEAKMTLYPGVTHNSWTRTYNLSAGHDIYAWLLQYKSPGAIINSIPQTNENSEQAISLYPNPSHESVTIDLGKSSFGKVKIKITDAQGKLIQTLFSDETTIHLSLLNYQPGLYIASLESSYGSTHCSFIKR